MSHAKHKPTPPTHGPDNPPRLRKPRESVEEYRAAMGWSILELPVTADTLVVGISLPARWSHGINRAAEILRQKHPKADDDEIMRMMLIHGMVDVIDGENNSRWPRNEDDDTLCAIAEAVL